MTEDHPAACAPDAQPDDTAAQQKRPRETKRGGWFIIDQELIELMQVPEPIARAAIQARDKNPREREREREREWFSTKNQAFGGQAIPAGGRSLL